MEQFSKFMYEFFVAISPALQVLLQSVIVALGAVATAYANKVYQTQKAKLSLSQQEIMDIVANQAVTAAQQVVQSNDEKLEYAFDIAEKLLLQFGLTVDVDVIYAMLEAKIFEKKEFGMFPSSNVEE